MEILKMKTTIVASIVAAVSILAANSAKADGFKCEGANTGLSVKVFNHVQPADGTRSAAVMILSDTYVNSPNKTIAKFTDENHTLAYKGYGLFEAKVDLRYIESSKKGENVAGTKLGQLKNINLQLYASHGHKFTYDIASVFKNKEIMDAQLTYVKRNGEVREEKAICARYTKN